MDSAVMPYEAWACVPGGRRPPPQTAPVGRRRGGQSESGAPQSPTPRHLPARVPGAGRDFVAARPCNRGLVIHRARSSFLRYVHKFIARNRCVPQRSEERTDTHSVRGRSGNPAGAVAHAWRAAVSRKAGASRRPRGVGAEHPTYRQRRCR